MNIDGNWAAAIIVGLIALLGSAVGYGGIRSRLQRLEESVSRRVSRDEFNAKEETYEQRQQTQEDDIKEIKAEVHGNRNTLHRLETKIDRISDQQTRQQS